MTHDKPRLLVVEDHLETQFLLGLMLEQHFELVTCGSASDAIAIAEDETFDVCMLDISLRDELDGAELMERLRLRPDFSNTPMIAMSAYYWDDEGEELLRRGFDGFAQKPFEPEELLALLERMVEQNRRRNGDGNSPPEPD